MKDHFQLFTQVLPSTLLISLHLFSTSMAPIKHDSYASRYVSGPFLTSDDRLVHFPILCKLTKTCRGQGEIEEMQKTQLVTTSRSQTTATKVEMKQNRNAESGQAPAGQTLKVSEASRCTEKDANIYKSILCPYHSRDPHMWRVRESQNRGLGPMDRFMAEGPTDQYAVFRRPDNGKLSISRDCTCNGMLPPKV